MLCKHKQPHQQLHYTQLASDFCFPISATTTQESSRCAGTCFDMKITALRVFFLENKNLSLRSVGIPSRHMLNPLIYIIDLWGKQATCGVFCFSPEYKCPVPLRWGGGRQQGMPSCMSKELTACPLCVDGERYF